MGISGAEAFVLMMP